MRASRVVTKESALRLNEIAREVSPALYWTCNYEPTVGYAIGYDAEFLLGVQDLYKFAIDTNCILKTIALNPRGSVCGEVLERSELAELRRCLDVIQNLRGCFDHNQSDLNGRISVDRRDDLANWVRAQLGKDEPSSLDDYGILCLALEGIGDSLVALSETILHRIRERPDRELIAGKWTDATLKWYCGGSRQDYYRGQLSDYYIARALARRPSFLNATDSVALRKRVNAWIGAQVTYRCEESLRKLEDERNTTLDFLQNPNPIAIKIRESNPERYEEAVRESRQRLSDIERGLQEGQQELDQLREAIDNRFHGREVSFFFDSDRLENQLRETLGSLEAGGEDFSLLPQSLLQIDVERNFARVPSPYDDF